MFLAQGIGQWNLDEASRTGKKAMRERFCRLRAEERGGVRRDSTDFSEFQRLAKQGNLIPVYDVFPRICLRRSGYLRIAQGARYSFLLESVRPRK